MYRIVLEDVDLKGSFGYSIQKCLQNKKQLYQG
jgi:hypothetical protein